MANAGLTRVGGGYSAVETLAARGHYQAAAEAYAERARNHPERVEATLRRAALLAGPLGEPETAAVELDSLRASALRPRDDFRVGLCLVDLYEHRLGDPGRAMGELRRLIDRYPTAHGARRLRAALGALKAERYPQSPSPS
jgi:TolA-binding protein